MEFPSTWLHPLQLLASRILLNSKAKMNVIHMNGNVMNLCLCRCKQRIRVENTVMIRIVIS